MSIGSALTRRAMTRHAHDLAACAEHLRVGSRSFWMASWLLPPATRRSASALYAFCRVVDDEVDDGPTPERAVDSWRERVRNMGRGVPANHPIDRALSRAMDDHEVVEVALMALLDGLAWDGQGRRYDALSHLFDYCARVASTVGVAMTALMGVRCPIVIARACDLGVAMQLTNIARDVGEDARRGRVYLPLAWLRKCDIDPDKFVASPRFDPSVAMVVARLLEEADRLYDRANTGISSLPWTCRPAIHAASSLYREIGQAVRARHYDSIQGRAIVSGPRKLALAARALLPARIPALDPAPPLPATAFLVEAMATPTS